VDGQYYHDVLLRQQMLTVIRRIAGNIFLFQQDSSAAHRARQTIPLFEWKT